MAKRVALVDDWRSSWRWISVRLSAALVVWGSLDAKTQSDVIAWLVPPERLPAVIGVLIIVGRVIRQKQKPPKGPPDGSGGP